jgi:hypothetical protein
VEEMNTEKQSVKELILFIKSFLVLSILGFISTSLFAQTAYLGTIGNSSVEIVMSTLCNDQPEMEAVYVLKNGLEPIRLKGVLNNNSLVLETNNKKTRIAFDSFDCTSTILKGIWQNENSEELNVSLTKAFDCDEPGWGEEFDFIQCSSTKDFYFKFTLSKQNGERITKVKVFDKKTGALSQILNVDCDFDSHIINSLWVEDFNFDGILDIALRSQSLAGPNTATTYLLNDPKTNRFFNSGYEGVSLSFDHKRKRIVETNTCCAGSRQTQSIYRVVNNKMVMIRKQCYCWSEKKNRLIKSKLIKCM